MEMRLFPPDKDPHTAAITIEELKKLVRCGGTCYSVGLHTG
jgi:hypothetical protein